MIAALRLVRWQPTFGWCQPGGNLWNILDSSSDSQFSSGCRTSSTQNGVKWRSAEKFTQGDLLQLRLGLKPGVGQLTDWIRSVALLVVSIHVLGIGSRESFHPKWHVFHASKRSLPGHLDERESTTERDLVVRVRTDLKAGEWFTNGDRVIFFVGEIDNNFSSSSLFPFSSGLLPFNSTISVDAQWTFKDWTTLSGAWEPGWSADLLARWDMKKCTPLWREAHFQVKMDKTLEERTTFGSWDVEKVHAVVARSTFWSQNAQNTPWSDHFWKLRCRKSARRCGAKHILKSKCTKHYMFAPLLEVPMSKKRTPLWREAHFEVKMHKTHHVRTTFGGSDVEKVSKKCTPLWREAHFEVKSVKNWGFWAFFDVKMSKK